MILLLGMLACGGGVDHALPTKTIRVGDQAVFVEVVHTPEMRARGLMHRDHLPADQGMLFIYPDTKPRSFWMKNTRIPLSIAYANNQGEILRISDMTPMSEKHVKSLYPAKYALEMNRGWFAEHGIDKGAMLTELPDIQAE